MFIDTNVFLYAAGRDHPLREHSLRILERIGSGDLRASTSTEVIQELLYVLTRRGNRGAGIALAREILDLMPDLLPVSKPDIALALLYMERYERLNVRDAVHLGTMLNNGIDSIITADRDFDEIEDVTRVDPGEY